jgi:hypothetical protein
MNVLIIGNYDDLRGDSAIYLLERAPSGSCSVYFSGTTGSLASNPIITHSSGNFTASIQQFNMTSSGDELIISASNMTSPMMDVIILHALDGAWANYVTGSLYATTKGIPVFTQHYNDTNQIVKVSQFYGFSPTIDIGWGNYALGNSGSYGNELEFFDEINNATYLTASVLMYGDNTGLQTTENSLYLNTSDVNINELNAVSSVASKYIKLVQQLSSSYVQSNQDVKEIYSNYTNNRNKFYYDIRQYFRQVATNSASVWTPSQSYGLIQIKNATGSYNLMPDITSGINLTNLGAGSPLCINVVSSSLKDKYTFSWKNFNQSYYQSTTVKVNDRLIYTGTDESFSWIPDIDSANAIVKFYTNLVNGVQSIPEANSYVNLGLVSNQTGDFLKLNYGSSCANNGTYIAIGDISPNSKQSVSGVVDVLKYSQTTNKYENKFLIRKLVTPSNFNLILATEDNTIDNTNTFIGSENLSTELSSSYDVTGSVALGTEQAGDTIPNQEIQTENLNFIYSKSDIVPFDNDALDITAESLFNLIESYSDKFGASLALYDNLLAVGCPYFNVNFVNGENYSGGSVDIFDLSEHVDGVPYYPIASISGDSDLTFGEKVTMYGDYLAIGSSSKYGNAGVVYIYKKINSDNTNWQLIQTLYGTSENQFFGGSIQFDKSGNLTLIVGNANQSNNNCIVNIYEFSAGQWILTQTLNSNNQIPQVLEYLENLPPITQPNTCDGFGNSVTIYGKNLIVSSPTDTIYSEYVGGITKFRGAVYFYQRCPTNSIQWELIKKSWGDDKTLTDNLFGMSVDMFDGIAIVSVPKYSNNFTSDYIENTLDKRFNCGKNDTYTDILGQVCVFKYDSTYNTWNILYTEQKSKEYGYPYLYYGHCNCIYGQTFVVGAPCFIQDYENLTNDYSDSIQGYAFIYNLNDLVSNSSIGNIFYRDGKIILSNSGSIFSGLIKNKLDDTYPKYDLTYKGKVTLYEKQVLCTINPGEFNYSTNPTSMVNNSFFEFKDLDEIFKFINLRINNNLKWWDYIPFTVEEQSLFNYYTENYDILNVSISNQTELEELYPKCDVDGDDRININDVILIWKYFAGTMTQNDVFKYIQPKSIRKTVSEISDYIKNNVIVRRYGNVNPAFFEYDYSSSIDRTGSYLAPYITTIGLYNGTDLVALAKLAHPIKNSGEFPLNILIKWDI